MSEEPKKRMLGKNSWYTVGEKITDPAELARLRAERQLNDGGVDLMVGAALGVIAEREARGKPIDVVNGVLALAEALTPEQQLEVARRLLERQPAGAPDSAGVPG
ncbi:MAG: hypothetical protein ACRC33_24765 [Gemmataceae bacterium]